MLLEPGTILRHLVKGDVYRVEKPVTVQHSGGDRSLDGEVLVRYTNLLTGRDFARKASEFEGRFEVLTEAP